MEHKTYSKVVLVIFDGFGVSHPGHGNAISQARTPNLNEIVADYPVTTIQASGPLVGLPWGEMGNSEVGHLNIGAGRIVGQDLPRITNSIQMHEFFRNPALCGAADHAAKNNSKLHLVGMVSPGGVHSLDEHAYALLELAVEHHVHSVYIHMFTDGRDTDEKVALESLRKLHEKIDEIGAGEVATIAGRFYAMDRGGHWEQTELTYQALVNGAGEMAPSAEDCIRNNYAKNVFDEMIKPTVILRSDGAPVARISDNDAVIFFNFRTDRVMQLTEMFVNSEIVPEQFRHQPFQNMYIATMTEYSPDFPVKVAFGPMNLNNNLAEVISQKGMSQFHMAESEKYAHVTVFFNCGRSERYSGEDRYIVASPTNNTKNYVDNPRMSADALTDMLVDKILHTDTNLFVANFANGDMVGHTGNLTAGIAAVEALDQCLGKIRDAVLQAGAALVVTADHGNVEQMINMKTGEIDKDHTTNPVPLLVVAEEFRFVTPKAREYENLAEHVPGGVVCDVAPTILDLFGIEKPAEMTGISLLNSLY